ncbi:hypothetical protein LTR41_007539 [Exophiala xenobiotica]|nr:hypothetical protein LTR41_007539 [Exophiala xenobiotica]
MATQLEKKVIQPGNKTDYPKTGDEVTIQYTGWLHEPSKAANGYKGKQFDSSVGRGDFKTQIGVGRVIPGCSSDVIGRKVHSDHSWTYGIWRQVSSPIPTPLIEAAFFGWLDLAVSLVKIMRDRWLQHPAAPRDASLVQD